jgi:hypothetical protein
MEELAAKLDLLGTVAVCEQSVMADAMEAVGEHVEQKATYELARMERHHLASGVLAIILPAKADLAIGNREQPAVRDCNAVRVAGQVGEHLSGFRQIIAADPKHLGAKIGLTAVLHTWAQNLDHHPHIHCIVPGGGISTDGKRWVACRLGFFLPVRVLSRLFRRLFLEGLQALQAAGQLQFFNDLAGLKDADAFSAYLAPLRRIEWVVYAKRPFAGPSQVLAYLAHYTHRVAIANSRLVSLSAANVSFLWKDYRQDAKSKVMTLKAGEFIRRFLMHTLPDGLHRIRHYGLFANGHRADMLNLCRTLLDMPSVPTAARNECDDGDQPDAAQDLHLCPCSGGRMKIIETFDGGRYHTRRFDSS